MTLTRRQIEQIAREQSAIDAGCAAEDFLRDEPVIVRSVADPAARRYLALPFDCQLISYGSNVVASVGEAYRALTAAYLERVTPAHCFETPGLHLLNDALQPGGLRVCFMAEYFLPDPARLRALPCAWPVRLLGPAELAPLYTPAFGNALCAQRRELDVLAVGAYDGGRLIGLAGGSADCERMWQIGVDVLPGYRRRGVAGALTSRLAVEILARGKVPFYCAAWCNLPSVRNALRCGFLPAWTELTAKPAELVDRLNGGRPL